MNNQQKNISHWPKRWRDMLENQPWSSPPVERVESPALQYLLMIQWSMGNGQCPDCHGVSPLWAGDFRYPAIENTGHKKKCPLAAGIAELGHDVRYVTKRVDEKMSHEILVREEPWWEELGNELRESFRKDIIEELNKLAEKSA